MPKGMNVSKTKIFLTSKCFERPHPLKPSWCRKVPNPIEAGVLWSRIAKKIKNPRPEVELDVELTRDL